MMITEVKVLGDKDSVYTIAPEIDPDAGTILRCSCPAWEYSKQPLEARACKHIEFLRSTFAVQQ